MRILLLGLLVACGSTEPTAVDKPSNPKHKKAKKGKAARADAPVSLRVLSGETATFTPCEGAVLTSDEMSPVYESDLFGTDLIVYERLSKAKTHTLKKFHVTTSGSGCKISKDEAFQEVGGTVIKAGFEVFDDFFALSNNADSGIHGLDGVKIAECKELWGVSRLERVPGVKNAAIGMHKNVLKQYTFTTTGCTVKELYPKPEDGMPGYYNGIREDGGWTGNFTPKGAKSQIVALGTDGSKQWVYESTENKRTVSDLEVAGAYTVLVDTGSKREIAVLDDKGADVGAAPYEAALELLGKYAKPVGFHHVSGGTFMMLVNAKQEDGAQRISAVRVDL